MLNLKTSWKHASYVNIGLHTLLHVTIQLTVKVQCHIKQFHCKLTALIFNREFSKVARCFFNSYVYTCSLSNPD